MKINLIIMTLLLFFSLKNKAQNSDCKVLLPDISGKYTGDCKDGLADGKGTAEGKDKYVGNFKKGLPNEHGIYVYSTGDVFEGDWKKGLRHGPGKLKTKINGKDTIITGTWKNGKLKEKADKSVKYEIVRNIGVLSNAFRKTGEGHDIKIRFYYGGIPTLGKFNFSTSYYSSGIVKIIGNDIVVENVEFPFKATYVYSVPDKFGYSVLFDSFEFIIHQTGDWEVQLRH